MDAAVIRAAPMTLVSNARRHVCTSTSVRRARGPIPVAYTRPSIPPSPVAASPADPDEPVVLDIWCRRLPSHPGLRGLRLTGPPADADLPRVPEPVLEAD